MMKFRKQHHFNFVQEQDKPRCDKLLKSLYESDDLLLLKELWKNLSRQDDPDLLKKELLSLQTETDDKKTAIIQQILDLMTHLESVTQLKERFKHIRLNGQAESFTVRESPQPSAATETFKTQLKNIDDDSTLK